MNDKRPVCIKCGRELVCIVWAFAGTGKTAVTWICDCETDNLWLRGKIVMAREWYDGSIMMDVSKLWENA